MSENFGPLPETLDERLNKLKTKFDEYRKRGPDAPEWFDRTYNERQLLPGPESIFWAAPHDVRYPQCKVTRHCFDYYVDYHRCIELLGAKNKQCKFFKNVYMDVCPRHWIQEWDKQVEQGIFPAKFDR